ncbi:hypothetical protein [Pelotomaculum propionicicum]|uniref:Uncharacterized protein n=1 Tax=Pelotomaculum propionicicum TaxID=258475 RepID=A0A4Y7RRN4_9FIRM|nr:hypothetical protein [Pelotomaculum propionicicum]TEB11533.1 hypothetical protein Pmgp_01547 [Pelotomaculum propionicicum]
MFEQLQANQGKNVVLELVNGRIVSGNLLAVNEQFLRVASPEGTAAIPVGSVYIVWENLKRQLTRGSIEPVAEQAEDVKEQIVCPSAYTCRPSYSCTPPHVCNMGFSCQSAAFNMSSIACTPATYTCGQQYVPFAGNCPTGVSCPALFNGWMPPTTPAPGVMNPGMPGGVQGISAADESRIPVCRPFQFGHCGPFQFGQPCTFQFGCGPFQFGQPCTFQFGCGPFQFGGSQCGTLGGFTCFGQQFFGLRPQGE